MASRSADIVRSPCVAPIAARIIGDTDTMPDPNPLTTALLAAMMHSRQPMVLTDPNLPDHPMIAVNPAFTGMTGYPESETVGRNCRFLQGSGTDRAATSRLHACIAERRGCVEWVLNHRKSGEAFWNLLFISPVFSRDGTLLHYFGNQRDITHGSSDAEAGDHHVLGKADMAPEHPARSGASPGNPRRSGPPSEQPHAAPLARPMVPAQPRVRVPKTFFFRICETATSGPPWCSLATTSDTLQYA